MYMVMDTSSDAAWVPCDGCTRCGKTTFCPSKSSTYQSLDCSLAQCTQAHGQACTADAGPCVFNQSYGGDSSFSATLVNDALGLGTDVVSPSDVSTPSPARHATARSTRSQPGAALPRLPDRPAVPVHLLLLPTHLQILLLLRLPQTGSRNAAIENQIYPTSL